MTEERQYSAESLIVGPQTYRYYPVSQVEGSKSLPYSLTVLLENVLRCARSAEEARVLADRVAEQEQLTRGEAAHQVGGKRNDDGLGHAVCRGEPLNGCLVDAHGGHDGR